MIPRRLYAHRDQCSRKQRRHREGTKNHRTDVPTAPCTRDDRGESRRKQTAEDRRDHEDQPRI